MAKKICKQKSGHRNSLKQELSEVVYICPFLICRLARQRGKGEIIHQVSLARSPDRESGTFFN